MATAIILAAGFSRRFGQNRPGTDKLLTVLHDKPLVRHVIDLVAGLDFKESILVYRDEKVKKLAPKNVKCVKNPHSSEGLSTSVRCGILNSGETDAFLFFMGDQPWVDELLVHRLLKAFDDRKGSIIVPLYDGLRGNPVLFGSKWRDELMELTGDSGGRSLIEANPEEVFTVTADNRKSGRDIDTWEDYLKFESETGRGRNN